MEAIRGDGLEYIDQVKIVQFMQDREAEYFRLFDAHKEMRRRVGLLAGPLAQLCQLGLFSSRMDDASVAAGLRYWTDEIREVVRELNG